MIKRKLNHVSFRVTINDFSTRKETVGEKIVTDNFSANCSTDPDDDQDGVQWHLQIFPRGREERFSNYVAVFLHLVTTNNDQVAIHGSYSLGLINSVNQVVFGRNCSGHFEPGRGWGYANYFNRDDILNCDNAILISGQLTMICNLYYTDSNQITDQHFDSLISLSDLYPVADGEMIGGTLADHFKHLFDNQLLTDVTIKSSSDGQSINCHKSILIQSVVFKEKLSMSGHDELIIDFESDIIRTMVNFLITKNLDIDDFSLTELVDLMKLAEQFKLKQMKYKLKQKLYNCLDLGNCIEMLINVDKLNCDNLKKLILFFIVDNISILNFSAADWKEQLTPTLLAELIFMISSSQGSGTGHRGHNSDRSVRQRESFDTLEFSESNTSSPPPPPYHSLPPPSHVTVTSSHRGHPPFSQMMPLPSSFPTTSYRRHNPPH